MKTAMNSSYGRARGDLSGAKFCGRVDVYFEGVIYVDPWGRQSIKSETYWTGYGDGDTSKLAVEVAERVGGEVRQEFFNPLCNNGMGYTCRTSFGKSIVVVPATSN